MVQLTSIFLVGLFGGIIGGFIPLALGFFIAYKKYKKIKESSPLGILG